MRKSNFSRAEREKKRFANNALGSSVVDAFPSRAGLATLDKLPGMQRGVVD